MKTIEEKGALEEVAHRRIPIGCRRIPSYLENCKEIEYWISRVAKDRLPGSQLRAALARQEIPVYDGPDFSSPEEDFDFITPEDVFWETGKQRRSQSLPHKRYPNPLFLGSIPCWRSPWKPVQGRPRMG